MKKKSKKEPKLIKFDAEGNPIPEKFQNPKKLGFMRLIMILYGFIPFVLLFGCFFITKDQFVLNTNTLNMIIDGVMYGVVF